MHNIPGHIKVGRTHCKYGIVDTCWKPDGQGYRSDVIYKDGTATTKVYQKNHDLLTAQQNHRWWVKHLNEESCLKTVGKKKNIKISLAALLRILYGWVGENHVATRLDQIESNRMYLSINETPMMGRCVYDLDTGEIVDITDFWYGLIQGHKMRRNTEQELNKSLQSI